MTATARAGSSFSAGARTCGPASSTGAPSSTRLAVWGFLIGIGNGGQVRIRAICGRRS